MSAAGRRHPVGSGAVVRWRAVPGILALLGLLGATAPALGQETEADERARTHFEAARNHYEDGAYDRALVEFQSAYSLSERPVLLLNLATVKERLGMYDEAVGDLREYLRRVPDEPDRDQLERRIANLERIARERAAEPPPDEGEEEPDLVPREASRGSAPNGPDDALLVGSVVAYGVAGAGAVVMAAFGGLALSDHETLAAGCGAEGACTEEQLGDVHTFALVSDVGLGVAVAGAAVGTTLLVLALTGDTGSDDVAIGPWLSPRGGGLTAGARF